MRDAPTEPYVYQPWGYLEDNEWTEAGRMWGVDHPSSLVTIKGLTRDEAQAVCKALREIHANTDASTV